MVCVNHPLTQKGCYRAMEPKMSQITRTEVLAQKRDRYARAGKEHKTKIINELVELFGYHRKAASRCHPDAGSRLPKRARPKAAPMFPVPAAFILSASTGERIQGEVSVFYFSISEF